jgi:hypothetical protein
MQFMMFIIDQMCFGPSCQSGPTFPDAKRGPSLPLPRHGLNPSVAGSDLLRSRERLDGPANVRLLTREPIVMFGERSLSIACDRCESSERANDPDGPQRLSEI